MILSIIAGVVIILLIIVTVAAVYGANMLFGLVLDPKGDRSEIMAAPHNSFSPEDQAAAEKRIKRRQSWLENVKEEETVILSDEGLKLHGFIYHTPAQANRHRWVIVCHGYDGKASMMLDQALEFSNMGFQTLLPDARAHGKSEGRYYSMGWLERRDMVLWIQEILRRDSEAQIVLYGISMGAATVMMTAGEELPHQVKAVIEDCGYTSVWDEFAYQLKALYRLPPFPMMYIFGQLTAKRVGFQIREASAVDQVKKSRLPILCIHGTNDTFVPSYMVDIIYDAASQPKQKLVVEGAEHGGANVVGGEQYWNQVRRFVFTYIEENLNGTDR